MPVEIPGRLVILGDPVDKSLSPKFQNAALRAAGIPLEYKALAVKAADLADVAKQLREESAAGNVTVPHKRSFLKCCSTLTPIAERIGAVNTFWTERGKFAGDNTDVAGFDRAARALLNDSVKKTTVAIIGAGGAAAAVLGAIESWPRARVRVNSRRESQSEKLTAGFSAFASAESSVDGAVRGANLLVNATPVGMNDEDASWLLECVEPGTVIMDLVYRPGGTPLVNEARAAGFTAVDGTAMLLEQGAMAFERWFGFRPDREAMRQSLM